MRRAGASAEESRQELLAQVNELAKVQHRGPEIQESAVANAERILHDEFAGLGWQSIHLRAKRKGDPQKVRIAQRLRRETTMTLAWIAEKLHMGAPSHVTSLLYRKQRGESSEKTLF